MEDLNIVEATIEDLRTALTSGAVTSVDLVAKYLHRISTYDCSGPELNSIPILNSNVFVEAAASDDRIASGLHIRPLEGIPFTVKDSYKVRGMTVASGSPAFKDLIANEDAFTVSLLRAAGGILIGKTNMPAMAYGGMQRGIYGRAESPYNPRYLAAAFWSGSSNGSGVSTAASFAAFGMGEETVSSGRSPASNNALVAYTPSRGWLSIRGNWPLYPTCDVVVPHTRSMKDMLTLLEVITAEDPVRHGDFWREQPFIQLEKPWPKRIESLKGVEKTTSLQGVRIAVPEMYIGGTAPQGIRPITTSEDVIDLWRQAREDLESLGAEVIVVPDFPVVTAYELPELLPLDSPRLPQNWHDTERGRLVAHGWNDFLLSNKDQNIPGLGSVDGHAIFPDSMRTPAELKQIDVGNAIHWDRLVSYVENSSMWDIENLGPALAALEGIRKTLLDDYLSSYGCDCFVFPAAGDVAAENADDDDDAAAYAWRNGVFYSNGNKALRHLGVPTMTVPMGLVREKKMPVGLTFAGRANDDVNLLKWAFAFEQKTRRRVTPPLTPALVTDTISIKQSDKGSMRALRPQVTVSTRVALLSDKEDQSLYQLSIEGAVSVDKTIEQSDAYRATSVEFSITVDGVELPSDQISPVVSGVEEDSQTLVRFQARVLARRRAGDKQDPRSRTLAPVVRDKTMVVVLARQATGGFPSAWLGLIDTP